MSNLTERCIVFGIDRAPNNSPDRVKTRRDFGKWGGSVGIRRKRVTTKKQLSRALTN